MANAYPPGAPTSGEAVPSDYDTLCKRVLETDSPRHVVLNCLTNLRGPSESVLSGRPRKRAE